MAQPTNPWSDWFNYVFTYFPTTNWQHAFSPTINFGCNTEDAPVEQHVLDSVGSYGFQLNRVLDALTVILEDPALKALQGNPKIKDFMDMAKAADDAAKEYQDQVATETGVRKLIKGMRTLQEADPACYQKLRAEILKSME
jgi:hypothetical protein